MRARNRLIDLLLTILGGVLLVIGPLQVLEVSYRGFFVAYFYTVLSLAALWLLWTGFAGLSFARPDRRTFLYVFALALPLAALAPGLSDAYHRRDETTAWNLVHGSQDARRWQNRYVSRVPESYRREGWRTEYALAVCRYSIDQEEYDTLPWFCEQAFIEHPEWYSQPVRDELARTYRILLLQALHAGPVLPPAAGPWKKVLNHLAGGPARGLVWAEGGRWTRTEQRRFEQNVAERYGRLLTFRKPSEAREGDLTITVDDHDDLRILAGNEVLLQLSTRGTDLVHQLGLEPVEKKKRKKLEP